MERARSLKRLLIHRSPLMPTGLLIFCLEYCRGATTPTGGVFAAITHRFDDLAKTDLRDQVQVLYSFRNKYIAHVNEPLADVNLTRDMLRKWTTALIALHRATQ